MKKSILKLWKILFAAEVDETNEAVENAEWVWTAQNTLLIEEVALTEEKVKIEGNTTTGILLYDDLR